MSNEDEHTARIGCEDLTEKRPFLSDLRGWIPFEVVDLC